MSCNDCRIVSNFEIYDVFFHRDRNSNGIMSLWRSQLQYNLSCIRSSLTRACVPLHDLSAPVRLAPHIAHIMA